LHQGVERIARSREETTMDSHYQARWISKKRLDAVRRSGDVTRGVVLDSFNGFLIIEPIGSELGDGAILSREDAEYELSPVWCAGSKARLSEARRLLGLPAQQPMRSILEVA
jgi:hypothetical protein